MTELAGEFAAVAVALYAGHHVGDYWVQTDHQAQHKGDAGWPGIHACAAHVLTYVWTQALLAGAAMAVLGIKITWGLHLALLISGVTHYLADRREYGLMFWLARQLPGKAAFMELGRPRQLVVRCEHRTEPGVFVEHMDSPQLATGAWALDQAWHIFWGVFVAALIAVTL